MGTGVKPGSPPAQDLHVQLTGFKVSGVYIGYLKFVSIRWFYLLRDGRSIFIVEIEPCDCKMGPRILWFLFDTNRVTVLIKFDHAIGLRVNYAIAEYSRAISSFVCRLKDIFQSMAII